jgi:hypothetical protein
LTIAVAASLPARTAALMTEQRAMPIPLLKRATKPALRPLSASEELIDRSVRWYSAREAKTRSEMNHTSDRRDPDLEESRLEV